MTQVNAVHFQNDKNFAMAPYLHSFTIAIHLLTNILVYPTIVQTASSIHPKSIADPWSTLTCHPLCLFRHSSVHPSSHPSMVHISIYVSIRPPVRPHSYMQLCLSSLVFQFKCCSFELTLLLFPTLCSMPQSSLGRSEGAPILAAVLLAHLAALHVRACFVL